MKNLRSVIAAALVFAGIAPAVAQVPNFNLPPSTVIGRSAGVTGPAQAIPFSQLLAALLTSPMTVSQVNVNSIVYAGSTSGSATVSAQAVAGTTAIKWPTVSGTVVTSATLPLVENAVTGAVSCPNCAIAVLTRTAAAAQDLSAYTVVRTLAYATAGDGGEATFNKLGAVAFTDTKVLTGTITTGGTCTNGTYLGISFSGGTGTGLTATVTVAGGVMSAVVIRGTGGQGYTVGDLLTASAAAGGGTGSITCTVAPTWTVATISTPTGSFTDSAGNRWQINRLPSGVDPRAFGYKADWTFEAGDAAATDNYTPLTNALNFASTWSLSIPDHGGTKGGVVLLPKFAGKFCGTGLVPLMIPEGVELRGQGEFSSVIKPCDSWNSNTNWVELCDTTTHYSCFAAKMAHMQLYVSVNQDTGNSTAAVAAIYSNNVQDTVILDHVKVYSGACRRGIWLETGYGGTTYNTLMNVGVFGGKGSASCGGTGNSQIFINYGTTQVRMVDLSVGGLSASFSGPRDNGITIVGGFVTIDGYHPEQIINPITINIPTALTNGMVSATNITGGVNCVGLVSLAGTNTPGNFILRPPMAVNGCTRMVTNAQPAGANLAAAAVNDTIFNP